MKEINVTLEIHEKTDVCEGCMCRGAGSGCDVVMQRLTGMHCSGGYMFKLKKEWVQCTKENTHVGDTVYYSGSRMEDTPKIVTYIFKYKGSFVYTNSNKGEYVGTLSQHKKEL